MPSINENKNTWSSFDWSNSGEEWSQSWGGSSNLWWGTIYPRIYNYLSKDATVLEIAPGYGRCTQYLKDLCRGLIIVDLTERCIEACKKKFTVNDNIQYFINDGKSLNFIKKKSLDFAFSWDSLVHADNKVLEAYISQLSDKLKPNGVAFIHHSNAGIFKDVQLSEMHYRDTTVTAKLVKELCDKYGLKCTNQEVINWGGEYLLDCISVFTPIGSRFSSEYVYIENKSFMDEAERIRDLSKIYRKI